MRIGATVGGRFLLEERAGSGGMGEVYRAVDQQNGSRVAIKVLRNEMSGNDPRFEREARILSNLEHPNIVRYVAHGATLDGAPFIAMQWLDGEDLSQRLSRGRLSPRDSITLALRVADGLGAAHSLGVVHRDLKPSNVFLLGASIENVKLLDFGVARLSAETRMTRTGALLGTPGYMAPEQARGEDDVDTSADVFSLGCVLFECLTGSAVFTAPHVVGLLAKLLFEEPPRVRDLFEDIPSSLDDLLATLLAKDRKKRPRDGQAALMALRSLGEMPLSLRQRRHEPGASERALTGSEQRSVAVILLEPPPGAVSTTVEMALRVEASVHGGHLERMVDGSLAVVLANASLATDLAAEAARCALALQARAPGFSLALGMGWADPRGHFSTGHAIDRAARRLVETSDQDEPKRVRAVLLDNMVAGLLDARFDVREAGVGFVLHGERELAEGTRTLLGKVTPCVGRERELRQIEQLFDSSLADRVAQAVLVTAPAGVGKSRLGQELLRHVAQIEGVVIWVGRGDSLRAGSAFGMLAQVLRGALKVRENEPLLVRRENLLASVSRHLAADERRRVAEFLGEIIGVPFPDTESVPLRAARADSFLMHDQMRTAFLDFIRAECSARPVVLVLEDLHWGDRATIEFVEAALRQLDEVPLFVLALARPEVHEAFPRLWQNTSLHEIRLRELPRRAVERLVSHVLGEKATTQTIERLSSLSQGNAFYLEELIRWAAEGRFDSLPETVVTMVQSRLGALSDESRRLLRAVGVFGEVSWTGAVAALLGGQTHVSAAREALAKLVDQEFLVRRSSSRFQGEEEWAFRHALLREGAYAMLTEEDRRLGHRLAGSWLVEHGEQEARVIADHYQKGGEGDLAATYFIRASKQAWAGGDAPTSIECVKAGLSCGNSESLRLTLLGALCEAHFMRVELASDVVDQARELSRIAPPGSLPWHQAMLIRMSHATTFGNIDEFLFTAKEILRVDFSAETAYTQGLAIVVIAFTFACIGAIAQGDEAMARLKALADALGDRVPVAAFYYPSLGGLYASVAWEDPLLGVELGLAAHDMGTAMKHGVYRVVGKLYADIALCFLGVREKGLRGLLGMEIPDEQMAHNSSFRPFVLAWVYADQQNAMEARIWAERLASRGKTRGLPLDEGRGRWVLAEVLRRTGDLEAAETEIQAALRLLAPISPLDHPGILATLAALRFAQGRTEEALAAAEEGMARYRAIGACSVFYRGAFLRQVHAICLDAAGYRDKARAVLEEARQKLLAYAEKLPDDSYRKAFLEDVPEHRKTIELSRAWAEEAARA